MNSIAVIIPVYNGERTLQRCLKSIHLLTEVTEIIIVDDGSTDKSSEIIEQWMERDNRISLLSHPGKLNQGRSASRNLAISKSTSEWITFCDADDFYGKQRFDAFAKAKKEDVDLFIEKVHSHYEENVTSESMDRITAISDSMEISNLQDYLISNREKRLSMIGIIVRKSYLKEHKLEFDETLETGEDTDFLWRLSHSCRFKVLPYIQPIIFRGVHDSNTYQKEKEVESHRFRFYKKWKEQCAQLDLGEQARKRIEESFEYYNYRKTRTESSWLTKMILDFKWRWKRLKS